MGYLLAAILALTESAIGLGVVLPGEVAITGIAIGLQGPAQLIGLVLAVAAGAVLGDHIGYLVGRRGGTRLGSSRLVRRLGTDRWERATAMVRRHGSLAVLVSRVLPFVRTVTPAVAGASGLGYAAFAVASAAGSLGWATLWVTAGGLVSAGAS